MFNKQLVYFLLFLSFFFSTVISGSEPKLEVLTPIVETLVDIAEQHRLDRSKTVPLIAIGGCPGVGKSHLTKNLLNTLQNHGVHCIILPIDDFILSHEERRKIGTEWDIRHFKASEIHDCLAAIFSGAKIVKKPTWNQLAGDIGCEVIDLNNIDLILFEGQYALCSRPPLNFFDYCQFGVFLEGSEFDVYGWRWEREQKKTQPRTKEQYVKHMEAVLLDYHQNIEYSKKNASFLIKKDSKHNYELEIQSPVKGTEKVAGLSDREKFNEFTN